MYFFPHFPWVDGHVVSCIRKVDLVDLNLFGILAIMRERRNFCLVILKKQSSSIVTRSLRDTVPEKGYLKDLFLCRKRLAVRTVRAETSRHNYLCITANTDTAHQNQSKYTIPFRSEQKSGLVHCPG